MSDIVMTVCDIAVSYDTYEKWQETKTANFRICRQKTLNVYLLANMQHIS